MSVEHGHDLVTRYTVQGSIVPGVKTPASYDSSGLSSTVSRVRYAFIFISAVVGSQLRCSWKAVRKVSPFDFVRIPGTRTPAITPAPGTYFTRIATDLVGNDLALPSPAAEFGGPEEPTSLAVEWEVVGGTNITAAFWEIDLPAQQQFPSALQVNGFDSGLIERDSNGNDRMLSDLGILPANTLYKPNGNPTLT